MDLLQRIRDASYRGFLRLFRQEAVGCVCDAPFSRQELVALLWATPMLLDAYFVADDGQRHYAADRKSAMMLARTLSGARVQIRSRRAGVLALSFNEEGA